MSRAKDSPLRDKMIELHSKGIEVKFIGDKSSSVFRVTLGSQTPEEHMDIVREVWEAIVSSCDREKSTDTKKLSRQDAISFVNGVKQLNN